jgi:hypothetical protein
LLRRVVPATPRLHEHRFFVHEGGRRLATPLFLCLALIEVSDVVFALDSVPAIFGVTLDPFIVFTSNVFAILGLRSLYFAIASLIGRFEYLNSRTFDGPVFIGGKMRRDGAHTGARLARRRNDAARRLDILARQDRRLGNATVASPREGVLLLPGKNILRRREPERRPDQENTTVLFA